MKITVITICLNSEKTIEKTIKSVVNQKYKDIEYIIIDGKSIDKTLNIVNKYKNKISKIVSEKDTGIYNAMNKGISLATGEFVIFMNADDCFYDNKVIKDTVKKLEKNPKTGVLYGDALNTGKRYKRIVHFHKTKLSRTYFIFMSLGHQAMFARRDIFKKIKFDETFRIAGDSDWIYKVWECKKWQFVPFNRVICVFNLEGASSKNAEKERQKYIKENFGILTYLFYFCFIHTPQIIIYRIVPLKVKEAIVKLFHKIFY